MVGCLDVKDAFLAGSTGEAIESKFEGGKILGAEKFSWAESWSKSMV